MVKGVVVKVDLGRKHEWKEKGVEIGYVLGLSLILAAIIYFFASNWPGFEKWTKIALSIGLLILFYLVSYLVKFIFQRHPSLSSLFLFFGSLSFGVCVALLGQIYNSHADSYMLFVIWSIPVLLLSVISKFQPFYVASFILIHLVVYFYVFPPSGVQYVPKNYAQWVFLGIAILNGILFFIIEKNLIRSIPLQYLSLIVFHVIMLGLTVEKLFDPFNVIVSLMYIGSLGFLYRYLTQKEQNKGFLVILGLASIAFVIIKFIEFVIYTNTEWIFLFTFILPFIIVGLVIYGLRKWKVSGKGEEKHSFFRKIVVGITTAVASIIAGSSLFGISFLLINDIPFSFFAFFSIALILLAKIKSNWDSIITYTLLSTALFIGIPATFESNWGIDLLFIAGLLYIFWTFKNRTIRYIVYLSMMIVITGALFEPNEFTKEFVIGCILLINVVLYLISNSISKTAVGHILMHNSMFYGLLSFFILTFLFEDQKTIYYLTNILYFVTTTLLVLWSLRKSYSIRYRIFLAFWFAFIVYKYYDLVWSLVHKSITFLITGLFVLLIIQRFDRVPKEKISRHLLSLKATSIIAVIFLQLAILGVQVGKSESLLANGDLIKLELAPVDPRSLLQGDYLVLRYNISSLRIEEDGWNEVVRIGLIESKDGLFSYSGHYVVGKEVPADMMKKADVWITGRLKGYENIEYGIENYFVPEGTGLDLQEKVHYAYVKVAENGDAMLVELAEE